MILTIEIRINIIDLQPYVKESFTPVGEIVKTLLNRVHKLALVKWHILEVSGELHGFQESGRQCDRELKAWFKFERHLNCFTESLYLTNVFHWNPTFKAFFSTW